MSVVKATNHQATKIPNKPPCECGKRDSSLDECMIHPGRAVPADGKFRIEGVGEVWMCRPCLDNSFISYVRLE